MNDQLIAAYSFLPWARQGLGIYLKEIDQNPDDVKIRGSIDVGLSLQGVPIDGSDTKQVKIEQRSVQLYCPGDIIGIDSKVIVRTEPRHWITNFENNYLPYIEFYDEDFPWRYTPSGPSKDLRQLRPWLALVVLEEGIEFVDGPKRTSDQPLPYIVVGDAINNFPPFDQLWAWAHVHVNKALDANIACTDTKKLAQLLDGTLRDNRDLAYSRLLCPRYLKENTAYHAFLIPSFETGRLAGLGKDPAGAAFATQGAWVPDRKDSDPYIYPYYYRWYFRTGTVGDFEYLVRLLQPRTVDPRVGRRDMDVQMPGMNLPAITNFYGDSILRLGGALRAPLETLIKEDREEYDHFEEWSTSNKPFQIALASLVNLSSAYKRKRVTKAHTAPTFAKYFLKMQFLSAQFEDPLIVPPIYGHWHALTPMLDVSKASGNWVDELNLDPRHRVTAGFGTQVIQKNQEDYMEAAWQQVGRVIEANQKIRYGQMAKLTSQVWHKRELAILAKGSPDRLLMISAPVQRRLLKDDLTTTIHHQMMESKLPVAMVSKTMRQSLRPHGRVMKLATFNKGATPVNFISRVNRGDVSPAPPKDVSPLLITEEKLAKKLSGVPNLPPLAQKGLNNVLCPDKHRQKNVGDMPKSSDFHTMEPVSASIKQLAKSASDSKEAIRYKEALSNIYALDEAEQAIPAVVRESININDTTRTIIEDLCPEKTITERILGSVTIPPRILKGKTLDGSGKPLDPFGEVMVYPEIDLPMYEPLKEISSELLLPNIQLIENNSITLLETNQKFIESYMVGVNHEFARELLWREYPTDQRGSYFRQFWDVRSCLDSTNTGVEGSREILFDIPEIHGWNKEEESALGTHNQRRKREGDDKDLVLTIRGELLKKYPTAVVYAQRAVFKSINGQTTRELIDLPENGDLPTEMIRIPLYEAKVDPEIYFFGFDLTVVEAQGGQIINGKEDPGWFFVIKERPGEPHFGLDLPNNSPHALYTWNDLSWSDVGISLGNYLKIDELDISLVNSEISLANSEEGNAKPQHDEDVIFTMKSDTHAAELAYILFQTPVLMAVHAAEMLKNLK